MDEFERSITRENDSDPPEWARYTIDELNEELAEGTSEIFDQFKQAVKRELGHAVAELTGVYRRIEDQIRMTIIMREICYPSPKALFWITINPDPAKITILNFSKKIELLMQRTLFRNYSYCFEQTGTTIEEMGKHPHVHILTDKSSDVSPAQMQKYIYSSVKHFCGSIKSVHVQVYPPALRADKEAYLRGEKWDEGKGPAVIINDRWRREHYLKDIYSSK